MHLRENKYNKKYKKLLAFSSVLGYNFLVMNNSSLFVGSLVFVNGRWFSFDGIDGDVVFLLDEDGGCHHALLSEIDCVNNIGL